MINFKYKMAQKMRFLHQYHRLHHQPQQHQQRWWWWRRRGPNRLHTLPQPAPPALLRQLSRSFERRRSVRRCSYPCTKIPVVLNLLSLCLSRACLGKRIVFGINMAPEKRATFAPPRELHVVIEGQRSLRQHVHVLLHVRCRGAAVVAPQEFGRELASIQRWIPAPRFKIQLIVLSGGYRSSQLIVLSEFVLHHIIFETTQSLCSAKSPPGPVYAASLKIPASTKQSFFVSFLDVCLS